MTHVRRSWWRALPVCFLAYVALALLLLRPIAGGLPRQAEAAVSCVVLPVMYMFQPVYPLLDTSGLLEGDWWRMPSYTGFAVAAAIYALILWAITKIAGRKC